MAELRERFEDDLKLRGRRPNTIAASGHSEPFTAVARRSWAQRKYEPSSCTWKRQGGRRGQEASTTPPLSSSMTGH